MDLLFSLLFWVLIGIFVLLFWHRKIIRGLGGNSDVPVHKEIEGKFIPEYHKRYRVMNNSEASFYYLLGKELPDDYFVFPKMRIADVLETVNGKGYYVRRNKILPKHIDFLICDAYFRPVLAIEIDGSSHNNDKQTEKDRQKDDIFKNAGLRLKRVIVGSSFQQEIEEIKGILND